MEIRGRLDYSLRLITVCKNRANFLSCIVQLDWLITDQL